MKLYEGGKRVYNKFKEDRLQLIKDHQDKAGVYCLVNLINGHTYIGSSINLANRMRNYLNNTLKKYKKKKIVICLLQKHC